MSQGERGIQGIQGVPGMLPPEVARRLRLQTLVTFVIVCVFCFSTALWQSHQTEGLRQTCQATDQGYQQFNKVIDQLARNAQNSTGITPQQKAQAAETYASIHFKILDCH